MRALKLGRDESGGSLIELALVLPCLFLLMTGAADFGKAYYLNIELARAAHAAALYGTQYPDDTAGMKAEAVADAADVPGFTTSSVTVTTGCECWDGSSAVAGCTKTPTCSVNSVNYVQVTTATTYAALFPYPGIPTPLALHGSARMRTK